MVQPLRADRDAVDAEPGGHGVRRIRLVSGTSAEEDSGQEPDPLKRSANWVAGADLADLVGCALTGDRRAADQLLRIIQPLVLRYCRGRVGTRERSLVSAEDITQEVCLAVVNRLTDYHYEPGSFLAFVYGIAAHKVADARRRAVRSRAEVVPELPDAPSTEDGPEQRVLNGELISKVVHLLHRLPDRQREILVLRVAVGLSAEETAAAVGSTAGAVRVAQHRALVRMRQMLAAER
jgi:RNA polymerase sigma-70 factor (ECF subfamily)